MVNTHVHFYGRLNMSDIERHNGPSVDCYGLAGDSKLNYDDGYCYESSALGGKNFIGEDSVQ